MTARCRGLGPRRHPRGPVRLPRFTTWRLMALVAVVGCLTGMEALRRRTHDHRDRAELHKWKLYEIEEELTPDPEGRWEMPAEVEWTATIAVPFSPETPASGIGDTGFYRRCWYRRTFEAPPLAPGERLLLHFGAVDWAATVWINGVLAACHEGGYTPFSAEIRR